MARPTKDNEKNRHSRIGVLIPREMRSYIVKKAASRKISIGDVVNEMLEDAIKNDRG